MGKTACHGKCLVPCKYTADARLGKWVSDVRISYQMFRKGGSGNVKITDERIAQIEVIDFEWNETKIKVHESYDK